MTHQQVIELVEKYLADNDSVTIDELKRAYTIAVDSAVDVLAAALAAGDDLSRAQNDASVDAYSAADATYRAADSYARNQHNSGAAYAAKASRYVKQYHEPTTRRAI